MHVKRIPSSIILTTILGVAGCNVKAVEPALEIENHVPCWLADEQVVEPATTSLATLKTYLLPVTLNQPKEDAYTRFSHGDFRFIGIGDFAVQVPAVDKVKEDEIICRYGVRYIVGTSDAIEGQEHEELIAKFREYARLYNKRMRELLGV